MNLLTPVLELEEARPATMPGTAHVLELRAGEMVLVQARDPVQATELCDLCIGLAPLEAGTVRFQGHDWQSLPAEQADALRGRIGRVFSAGGWVDYLDMATNIMLPGLHHTRRDATALREEAGRLAAAMGLPGLPTQVPGAVHPADLARAAVVRALLNQPALILLESPLQDRFHDLLGPMLNGLADARSRGAAILWLSDSDAVWRDPVIPASRRLRLESGSLRDASARTMEPV